MQIETSDVPIERLSQGKLDVVIGRLLERHDKTDLRKEGLVEEPVCAVARRAHPLLAKRRPGLDELAQAGWIVPATGTVLRHRFELTALKLHGIAIEAGGVE